jgi:hypothetical protein
MRQSVYFSILMHHSLAVCLSEARSGCMDECPWGAQLHRVQALIDVERLGAAGEAGMRRLTLILAIDR